MSQCKTHGCDRAQHTRGWCATHYRRVMRTGDEGATMPFAGRAKSPIQRLEEKSVLVPLCGCRLWVAAFVPAMGYGVMFYQGRQQYAHRVAWQLAKGPIPSGLFVLHRCDTPACVNVDHLFLGTTRDNVLDMMAKGRARMGPPSGDRNPMRLHKGLLAGARNGSAKLTAEQVEEIRAAYAGGAKQVVLARLFGVNQPHISRIVRGDAWAQ